MRKLVIFAALTIASRLGFAAVPELKSHVNDYASLLGAGERQELDIKLSDYERKTSNQVVVLTVPDMGGSTVELFANEVFHSWKLGQKGKDNGVLLVVGRKERKVRIEVGYGLEGKLTDLVTKSILQSDFIAHSKKEEWSLAIRQTAAALMKAAEGEYKAPEAANPISLTDAQFIDLVACGIVTLVLGLLIEGPLSRCVSAGVATGLIALFAFKVVGAVVLAIIAAVIALFIRFVADVAGSYDGSSSGSSGGFFGGDSGFSGGGGDSGGGGASSDA